MWVGVSVRKLPTFYGVAADRHALSVNVVMPLLRWLGSFHLVFGSDTHCHLCGLAFEHSADIRWEGPTGVT